MISHLDFRGHWASQDSPGKWSSDAVSRSEAAEDITDDGAPLTWQDKVNVVRTRRHISDLNAAVKEKEDVVTCKRLVRHFQFSLSPRKSEGLCFYRHWFVCLSVCLSVCLLPR